MPSPFQQLVIELTAEGAHLSSQLAYLAASIAIGIAVGYVISRKRDANIGVREALIRALLFGVSFPIVTFVLLWGMRFVDSTLASTALMRLAVPLFAALCIIRFVARILRSLFPRSALVRSLVNITSIVVWLGFALHLLGLSPTIIGELEQTEIPIGKTRVSVMSLLQGFVLVVFTLLAALWAAAAVEQRMKAASINVNTQLLLSRLLRAFLLVVALLFSLSAVGIDLTVLSVFGGALGVGLGLGLQRIAANYVSGFAMLVEGSFRVGDYVRLDNFEGTITQINSRYTVVRAANGRESVIPNETFMTQRVEHSSLSDTKIAVTSTLLIDYGSNVNLARDLIVAAALTESRVLKDPAPGVFVSSFAADGIELTISFWIADPENGQLALRSNINLRIMESFEKNGISIPFPQRVLRVVDDAPPAKSAT